MNDPRGLTPEGRHIPSEEEWQTMITFLGSQVDANKKLKSQQGWKANGNGTKASGFNLLPAGYRYETRLDVGVKRGVGFWWTSTEFLDDWAWMRNFVAYIDPVHRGSLSKSDGLSVRCVQDYVT